MFGCCYGATTFITAASVYISAYKEVPSGECKLLVKLCAWVSSTTCCLVLVHAQCSSGYTLATLWLFTKPNLCAQVFFGSWLLFPLLFLMGPESFG